MRINASLSRVELFHNAVDLTSSAIGTLQNNTLLTVALEWFGKQAQLIYRIFKLTLPDNPLTEDMILDMIFKLNCNCFGIWSRRGIECMATAIFPEASFFNHNCMPNCRHIFFNSNREVFIKTLAKVPCGTELCINYINIWKETQSRQEELKTSYFFDCTCVRCVNPEAYENAIQCLACPQRNCVGLMIACSKGGDIRECSKCHTKRSTVWQSKEKNNILHVSPSETKPCSES